jgi:hypothetical protein
MSASSTFLGLSLSVCLLHSCHQGYLSSPAGHSTFAELERGFDGMSRLAAESAEGIKALLDKPSHAAAAFLQVEAQWLMFFSAF